ncbi:hypothetical protein [Actinomadura alba]|uniref:Tat pathway signal sequence domain protein n=1 Tax=Actinomadura alba TaxID=406431 RepID=A0ABR7M202_9ACTN|nr:hypothetical protein [Actinomadura alba]MBC6471099.1 hypothetical protein [Actinomadura alba]
MNELQQIARVDDKDLAGQASGAGAQALLAAIVAEEPAPAPRRRPLKRILPAATATAALAAAALIGPSVVNGKGTATSYASSAIEVWKEGDRWKSRIKDPFADPAEFEKAFRAIGVDVTLELEPASPRFVGQIFESGAVLRGKSGTSFFTVDQEPEGCALTSPGCTMLLSFSTNTAGQHFKVGRPAKPKEAYEDSALATTKSGSLAGYRVDEKTVREVVPEIEKRGLKVVYQIIDPNPNSYGFTMDPKRQNTRVGDDWVVWEAQEAQLGVVRLLVTDKRYDKNPVYGGPRDKVIKD